MLTALEKSVARTEKREEKSPGGLLKSLADLNSSVQVDKSSTRRDAVSNKEAGRFRSFKEALLEGEVGSSTRKVTRVRRAT